MAERHSGILINREDLLSIIKIQTEVVQEGLNLCNIMFLVADRAMRITESDGAVVELKQDEEMVYRATAGISSPQLGMHIPTVGSLSGMCVAFAESLYCADAETDPRVDRVACRRVGLRSMIVTPLSYGAETVGVLKVLSRNPNWYNEEKIQIMVLLSELISAAMYTAEQYSQEELFKKATCDGMTGIKNRSMFYDMLQTRLTKAERLQEKFGILLFDMDNLKKLNDSHGHKLGDAGILTLVERVRDVLRESDTFCRLGGDEFGIIAESVNSDEAAAVLGRRILDRVNKSFIVEGASYELSVSLGCSVYGEDGLDIHSLIDIADRRMYEEKRKKKGKG